MPRTIRVSRRRRLCGAGPCDCVRKLAGLQVLPLQPTMVPCRRLAALDGSGVDASAGHLSLPLVFRGDVIGTLNVANEGYGPFTSEETSRLAVLANALAAGIAATRLAVQAETRRHEHLRETQGRTDRSERLRAVGEVASGVAHDFNNLLTAILGSAELLSRAEEDPHRQEDTPDDSTGGPGRSGDGPSHPGVHPSAPRAPPRRGRLARGRTGGRGADSGALEERGPSPGCHD